MMSLGFCLTQEVGQQLVPCFCEHTFRMELHPLQMGVVAMAQPHDRSVFEPTNALFEVLAHWLDAQEMPVRVAGERVVAAHPKQRAADVDDGAHRAWSK